MVKAIKAALDQDIDAATWMSDATKKAAHAKLAAQVDKIGYPDHWRDYSSVEIKRDDFLGNMQRAQVRNQRRLPIWPAVRPLRLGHDAAHGKRLRGCPGQYHQFPRRYSAAAVL